eukprot:923060-Pleurochrysis_carterae.AAC.1
MPTGVERVQFDLFASFARRARRQSSHTSLSIENVRDVRLGADWSNTIPNTSSRRVELVAPNQQS